MLPQLFARRYLFFVPVPVGGQPDLGIERCGRGDARRGDDHPAVGLQRFRVARQVDVFGFRRRSDRLSAAGADLCAAGPRHRGPGTYPGSRRAVVHPGAERPARTRRAPGHRHDPGRRRRLRGCLSAWRCRFRRGSGACGWAIWNGWSSGSRWRGCWVSARWPMPTSRSTPCGGDRSPLLLPLENYTRRTEPVGGVYTSRPRNRTHLRARLAAACAGAVRLCGPRLGARRAPRSRSRCRGGPQGRCGGCGRRIPRPHARRTARFVLPHHDLREVGHLFSSPCWCSSSLRSRWWGRWPC